MLYQSELPWQKGVPGPHPILTGIYGFLAAHSKKFSAVLEPSAVGRSSAVAYINRSTNANERLECTAAPSHAIDDTCLPQPGQRIPLKMVLASSRGSLRDFPTLTGKLYDLQQHQKGCPGRSFKAR